MLIRIDSELLTIGDTVLNNSIIQSITVGGQLIINTSNNDNTGVSKKVVSGYDDKTVNISLVILPTDEGLKNYNELKKIEEVFSNTKQGKPIIYTLILEHIQARNIDKLLFSKLSSSEDNKRNTINVELEFIEFVPAKWVNENKTEQNTASQQGEEKDKQNKSKEKENKFLEGFKKGSNFLKGS